jgi:protein-tyrosine-phosphatase
MEEKSNPSAVLFVCTQNVIRSPMAAAILHSAHGAKIHVASAGIKAGDADGFVGAVMEEIGLDLTRHTPHTLDELMDHAFDLIVTLSPEAEAHARDMTRTMAIAVEHWPIPDPSLEQGNREQRLEAYRAVRDRLTAEINKRFG